MRASLALSAFAATLTLVQAGLEKNGTQNIAVYWGKVFRHEEYPRQLTNECQVKTPLTRPIRLLLRRD